MADEKADTRFRSKNFKLGFIFLIVTIGVFLLAFASPYWSQTWVTVPWDFKNMGLWEICLDNYIHREDQFATIYTGCYWSFSRAMDNVRVHWNPPFFVMAQVFSVISLLLLFVALIMTFLTFIRCIGESRFVYWIFTMVNVSCCMVTGLLMFVTVAVVGGMSGDRNWQPRADLIWLTWGYGFAVLSSIFSFVTGFFWIREARLYWGSQREDEVFKSTDYSSAPANLLYRTGDASQDPPGYSNV